MNVLIATVMLAFAWPEPTREMKPWVYNWWMGSAVDEAGMELQCRELAEKGFGGFHVIPIYGAKNGWEKKWKPLLSKEWIAAWNMAADKAKEHSLGIDLTMGSGWCFGGPWIDKRHAASSGMKVKRAGLGGTGYMLDPFDPEAMKLHVAQFDKWFGKGGAAARPRAFYHDSYEYYGAEPKNGGDIDDLQVACFRVWTDWCRENGYLTRNEAHGSPCNWLDFYAIADIPETEMFGAKDRDILVSKFASSAAHVKGTRLVSAETCTWIDEHFRERPSEIKSFIDRLFLSGVNHIFYHGCCYSPADVVWPGWCFYASLEMTPRNPIWREMGELNAYVTRCQSLFQTWTPDNDLAVLWDPAPYRAKHPGKVMRMTIHNRDEWFYGEKIGKAAKELYEAGYAFDYVSPRMVKTGLAKKYAAVVDPESEVFNAEKAETQRRRDVLSGVRRMPFNAASGLLATRWKKDGETAYFVVNTGAVARVVSAGGKSFGAMNPLTGEIEAARREAVEIAPAHSLFLVGDGFETSTGGARPSDGIAVAGPWEVSPVCGGPAMPAKRALEKLVGWETFDEAFSGTMLYRTTFDLAQGDKREGFDLSLGEVCEMARVRLNGRDLGVRFMAPYRFGVPHGILKEKGNVLEVEVTNLGANRLRWNDLNGVDWKYFSDTNVVGSDYKKLDASKWKPLESGLLGPVELLFPVEAEGASGCGDVRLKGRLGERLDAMIRRHVAARDVDYITAPFMEKTETKGWWQTEFWGKWMHSAVPYLRYAADGKCKVESAKCKVAEELCSKVEWGIERMLSSQEPSGYIGNYPDELRCGEGWDVWGMKYTMMGLLHYYDYVNGRADCRQSAGGKPPCQAFRALEACRRLCDYVIAEIGPHGKRGRELWQTGNWSGYASSSILEPVAWLYKRVAAKDGKDAAQKYLDFATYIVKGMAEPKNGPRLMDLALKGVSVADRNEQDFKGGGEWSYVCKHGRSKAYEMMSCYQGLLEYYEIVKSCKHENIQCPVSAVDDILKAAVMTAEDIAKEEVNLAGGCASSEAWFHGAKKQHLPYIRLQETCVTTTWMRFCEKLLEVTGDPKWADQIERTFYNAYLGALRSDGGEFAAYTPLTGNRWHGMNHCFMHTDCCTANGPRGFLCFLKELFTTRGDAATFNFYSSALVKGELSGGRKVAFDMYSLYPRTDYVRIVSHSEGSAPVRLRIPAWSAKTEVKLNGKAFDGVAAGSYFTIDRDWKLGDIVELKFDMPVVAHALDHHVAFTRGPVLLARDSRFADGDLSEPFRRGIKDGQAMPTFAAVCTPSDDIWMAFSATLPIGSHAENPEARNPSTVFFCDYASAGNTWTRANFYRTWFPVEYGNN